MQKKQIAKQPTGFPGANKVNSGTTQAQVIHFKQFGKSIKIQVAKRRTINSYKPVFSNVIDYHIGHIRLKAADCHNPKRVLTQDQLDTPIQDLKDALPREMTIHLQLDGA